MRVPQIGWNDVEYRAGSPLFAGVPPHADFYFVHSYIVEPADEDVLAGSTDYAGAFTSAVARDNIFGSQFHPEKSGRFGLRLYRNFVEWASTSFPR